jgi:hypothetical protein
VTDFIVDIFKPNRPYTDKKENEIFLIYKEIQSGADAKSSMRKSVLIYSMRNCANISPYMNHKPANNLRPYETFAY